jgi:hypothetical protein
MSPPRGLLKFACRAILAVGLAGAAFIVIGTAIMGATDLPYKLALALVSAAGLAASAVFIAGVLGLLISIDERLEQLVNKAGGQ